MPVNSLGARLARTVQDGKGLSRLESGCILSLEQGEIDTMRDGIDIEPISKFKGEASCKPVE